MFFVNPVHFFFRKNKKDDKIKVEVRNKRKSSKDTMKTKEEEEKTKDEKARLAFEEWEKKQVC